MWDTTWWQNFSAKKREECIAEALIILKRWNPKYFMVYYSTAEINAIENEFPNVSVYICDFHREQARQRWAKTSKNELIGAVFGNHAANCPCLECSKLPEVSGKPKKDQIVQRQP